MKTEIKHKAFNTQTGNCYVITNDNIKRSIIKANGLYGFISNNKVLENTLHISPIGKPAKYFNEFNEADQKEISDWINS